MLNGIKKKYKIPIIVKKIKMQFLRLTNKGFEDL
jgi:hypothetical protein